MSGLSLMLSCEEEKACFENHLAPPPTDKSVIIAISLVKKGELATAGVTVEALSDGTMKPDEVIDEVRDLQRAGKAVYYPKGVIKGSKPMPTEVVNDQTYGLDTEAKPTGDVTVTANVLYQYFYSTQTVAFHNRLRKNREKYDMVYWTDKTVVIVQGTDIAFFNIGHTISGDANQTINGGFDFRFLHDGEPLPFFHNASEALEGFTKFTITPPTLSASITADTCSGSCKRYTGTYASGGLAGTMTFAVSDAGASCVKWEIVKCGADELPVGVSINEATGVVTFASFTSAQLSKFTVVAYNETCLAGEFCFEIRTVVAP